MAVEDRIPPQRQVASPKIDRGCQMAVAGHGGVTRSGEGSTTEPMPPRLAPVASTSPWLPFLWPSAALARPSFCY